MPQAPTAHITGPERVEGGSPSFTIVTAVYNVARYLPEFIDSIDAQTYPGDLIEVVAVDDGSTDESLEVLREWERRRPGQVKVLSKENGGQGSARNLGMQSARGEWMTYIDPDDVVPDTYFASVASFIQRHDDVAMVATNRILWEEAKDLRRDGHPLRRMFQGGDQLVDLRRFPDYFHGSAPAAFVRRAVVEDAQLRFDDRIQPNFEDGHFCCKYLLASREPLVGFLKSAEYIYRKRADQSSTLQNSLLDPRRYTNVPRFGYLDVLRYAMEQEHHVPEWLQNMVLYELSYYFSAEASASNAPTAGVGQAAEEMVEALTEIRGFFDPEVVESFSLRRFDRPWRDILVHGLQEQSWHTPYVVLQSYDHDRDMVRIAYRFTGEAPQEEILVRGRPVTVEHGKVRGIIFFEHVMLKERLAWVPAKGTLRVRLNGRLVELRGSWPNHAVTAQRPNQLRNRFRPKDAIGTKHARIKAIKSAQLSWSDRLTVRLADSWPVRRLFADAWVLMDRIHNADDSGERLFRYLREHRRDVNAWFVLERDTPDWKRLKADGYRRVVAYDSRLWRLLMLNSRHLISSHIDVPVHEPPAIVRLRRPRWRFTFLQHGVIKDDLSGWLNGKKLSLFVTSTPDEHQSIVGDLTPYIFTSKEVKMTGLPRFDRLREVGQRFTPESRNLLLLAPTWRHWLTPPLAAGSQRRTVHDSFMETEFAQQWLGLLASPELKQLAQEHGLTIAFLPHPNLQQALEVWNLPEHVIPLSFEGADVQEYFARAAVMVTDYSSMAFNAAYIDRPVVYLQFDRDRVLNGGHVGRAGYFDYYEHGFGPVLEGGDDVVKAVNEILDNGRQPLPMYADRIAGTFPDRDGNCCERVVTAIEALDR
ncbi:glycosyltransferase [Phycicoccus sp. SLBN-51]|uniref:bifunctional glycosyltransferase/CDP-glycerol:glycerophosphate glycerophosphotransferase n=1 Tax=Phycicoccus sp. SLBN-51 TaxID=2768447 RepID=UPI00114E1E56|nr:glycosyltransferase [Phycicoccus sp. SLBN-51]TQJ48849.1 CDP-glycerol glycerophosphotransferase (TagB/SpsB family) [Phycicoccus sp. SLBN-51]